VAVFQDTSPPNTLETRLELYGMKNQSLQGSSSLPARDLFLSFKKRHMNSPSRVRGCSVTVPVWMYSMSWRNTSGSNSSTMRVLCWPPCGLD